jgi:hypothetical protein
MVDSLPDANIKAMDQLEEVFLKRWSVEEDSNMLLTQLNEIRKSENESVREFHTKFERLLQQIPKIHHPGRDCFLFLYTKAFSGQFRFMRMDKGPRTIQEAHEITARIEAILSSSKVERFYAPRTKVDVKPKVVHDAETVNVYAIIIVLCISIDKSIIRTRSLRNTHSQETQHLSWETL